MELTNMVCAIGTGVNKSKKCLKGTRVGILNEVVDWINTRDPNTPHVFWLSGQAGKGKPAIAYTVAAWAKDLGVLGSCFCFARDRRAEHRHEKMFTTIARDLADCDPLLRRALASALSRDFSLKSTVDIEAQWYKLIVEPLSKVAEDIVGNLIVVIDALDESGHGDSREASSASYPQRIPAILQTCAYSLHPDRYMTSVICLMVSHTSKLSG